MNKQKLFSISMAGLILLTGCSKEEQEEVKEVVREDLNKEHAKKEQKKAEQKKTEQKEAEQKMKERNEKAQKEATAPLQSQTDAVTYTFKAGQRLMIDEDIPSGQYIVDTKGADVKKVITNTSMASVNGQVSETETPPIAVEDGETITIAGAGSGDATYIKFIGGDVTLKQVSSS